MMDGLRIDVLQPENEPHAERGAGGPQLALGAERHVATDNDVGAEAERARREEAADLRLEEGPPQELPLVEPAAGADALNPEIRWIHRQDGELALWCLEFREMQVQDGMAARGQAPAELDLQGVAGIVADDDAHGEAPQRDLKATAALRLTWFATQGKVLPKPCFSRSARAPPTCSFINTFSA